jgi:hypothetical protein
MCVECGCTDANGNQMRTTITAGVRVAEGQSADIIKGFDVPPPPSERNKVM